MSFICLKHILVEREKGERESKRGSSKARGYRQGGEAVEGGEKGQLDGNLAGTRISKGRKMPHINVIYTLAKH